MEQWDRTVAYWTAQYHHDEHEEAAATEWCWSNDIYSNWLLGVITKPTKLFNAGDLVIVQNNNGSADRYTIYAVSSKGYPVKYMYLPIGDAGDLETYKPPTNIHEMLHSQAHSMQKHRPVYIPEPPFYLSRRSPHDTLVREYIAALQDGSAGKLIETAARTINFVRVSLDHATGLGAKDSSRTGDATYTISYSELALPTDLVRELVLWIQSRYTMGPDGTYPSLDTLNAAGMDLAKRVKRYLGDKTRVIYTTFDYQSQYAPSWKPPVDHVID